jgi:AraC family transcriptional regulator
MQHGQPPMTSPLPEPGRALALPPGAMYGRIERSASVGGVLLAENRYDPGERLPRHSHEHAIFCLVLDGGFDECFDRRSRSCARWHFLYRPPREVHAQRFFARGAHCFTVELSADESAEPEAGAIASDGRLDLRGMPTLLAFRLYDEFRRPDGITPLAVEELTVSLVASGARRASQSERGPAPPWLRRAREYLESHYAESLTVRALAAEVGVHRVHLSRTFRRYFGCGIAEYVRRLRVHAVCRRVGEGRQRFGTIAADLGFSDESHMGRSFHAVMGCTPSRYRRGGQPSK